MADPAEEPRPTLFQRVEGHIQRKTLDGLLDFVPILVTLFVLIFIIERADNLVRAIGSLAARVWDFPDYVRYLDFTGIGVVVAIIVFYIIGLLISTRIGRRVVSWRSVILDRIPVVKTIFGVTQQATTALTGQYRFTRVVFVEWPREGMVALGFVTGRAYSIEKGFSLVVVYIPTVPNPTSGNMALIHEDDVIETDLTVEDAMKLVFSGGIVLPEAVSLARVPREETDFELIGRFDTDSS